MNQSRISLTLSILQSLTITYEKVDVVSGKDKEVIYDDGSQYVTVFDPLDGSSNIDAGIPTGKID